MAISAVVFQKAANSFYYLVFFWETSLLGFRERNLVPYGYLKSPTRRWLEHDLIKHQLVGIKQLLHHTDGTFAIASAAAILNRH